MKKRLLKPIQNRAIVWQHLDVIKPLNFTNGVLSINKDNLDAWNGYGEEISALKKDWKEIQFTIGTGSCFIEFDTKGAKEICFAGRIRENQTRNYIGIAGVSPPFQQHNLCLYFEQGKD